MTTAATETPSRAIIHRTRGGTHGPITRLVSPTDLGQFLKPFVFLVLFSFKPGLGRGLSMHPHSGVATLTVMTEGDVSYEDTTGKKGVLPVGGVEWLRTGSGIWHTATPVGDSRVRGFQLWVALPASEEIAPAESMYLLPGQIPQEGPARVLLGQYGQAQSPIPAPGTMTYLTVRLKNGERWRYTPPTDHMVAWVAVNEGQLAAGNNRGGPIAAGELAVFDESVQAIDFVAHGETAFVLGSAVKHPYELEIGYHSIHTTREARLQGEAEIERIGARLREEGRLEHR